MSVNARHTAGEEQLGAQRVELDGLLEIGVAESTEVEATARAEQNNAVQDAVVALGRRAKHTLLPADHDEHIVLGRVRNTDDLIKRPHLDADTAAGRIAVENIDDGELGTAHESVLARARASRDGRRGDERRRCGSRSGATGRTGSS